MLTTLSLVDMNDALRRISARVSEDANNSMTMTPDVKEVKSVLFQMHPNKAPGIDGMYACFILSTVLGYHWGYVINFVVKWWMRDADIDFLTKTCIVLIPNCKTPQQMGDSRPISLCTVLYKIISKLMANRLKLFLSDLISALKVYMCPEDL